MSGILLDVKDHSTNWVRVVCGASVLLLDRAYFRQLKHNKIIVTHNISLWKAISALTVQVTLLGNLLGHFPMPVKAVLNLAPPLTWQILILPLIKLPLSLMSPALIRQKMPIGSQPWHHDDTVAAWRTAGWQWYTHQWWGLGYAVETYWQGLAEKASYGARQ